MRPPYLSPRRLVGASPIKCSTFLVSIKSAPRVRYIGEGVPGARECDINASPMSASFDSFLAETRKEYIESYRYNETDTQISGVRKFVIRGQ